MSESIWRRSPNTGVLEPRGLRYTKEELRATWRRQPSWTAGQAAVRAGQKWDDRGQLAQTPVVRVPDCSELAALQMAALWVRRGGLIEDQCFVADPQHEGQLGTMYLRTISPESTWIAREVVEVLERFGPDILEGGPLFAPPDGAYDLDVVELAKLLQEWAQSCYEYAEKMGWEDLPERTRLALERQFLGKGRSR